MLRFQDKVIWIAGASSGIGEGLVYAFINEGARVIASAPFEAELNKVRNNCREKKGFCHIVVLDMTKPGNFQALTDKVVDDFGRIDILIHIAGISQRALIQEISMDTVRKIMEVNFFGAVALTKAVLPVMQAQAAGQIVATSSIVGKFGFPLRSIYSASKHALHGFFESLQAENMENNISVTLLIPGRINTGISFSALTGGGKPWGKNDAGQSGGISVEKATRIILRGISKRKMEVLIGGKELMMVRIKRFCPWLFWRMVNKIDTT